MGQGSSRPDSPRRPRARLHRASQTLSDSIPQIFRRRTPRHAPSPTARPNSIAITTPSQIPTQRPRPLSTATSPADVPSNLTTLPDLQLPTENLGLNFDSFDNFRSGDVVYDEPPAPYPDPLQSWGAPSSPSNSNRRRDDTRRDDTRRDDTRRPNFNDRIASALRRRRRSPLRRGEDQAALLSRLLSVAAAATAASLMGEDQRSVSDTRPNLGGDDEDGTFDSFLQALQNGRIASALRGENAVAGEEGGMPAPLNFFRMFRFGSSTRRIEGHRPQTGNGGGSPTSPHPAGEEEGRMVPIIIVGIRSIHPGAGPSHDDNIPPFLDALSTFPSPLNASGENALDGLLRQPTPTTRFSHRRRASMGGFPATYDNQRHHPRPPPSTPASSALSALSSGNTTPTRTSSTATHSAAPSRRESFVRRPTGGLETTAEEPTQPRTARQRRLSESDFTRFGSGSSRRNGVVEPDHNPGEGSRSWIIYVLGGSYPENHPILTTPSLFTDSPTYEDMMLLSALLGPAKPPVASEDDVVAAAGLFRIVAGESGGLMAVAEDVKPPDEDEAMADEPIASEDEEMEEASTVLESGETLVEDVADGKTPPRTKQEVVLIGEDQRCLVCLSEYAIGEQARRLAECQHLFHQECIDHWLLHGRNSCPLCRRQGVDEKIPRPEPETGTFTTSDNSSASSSMEADPPFNTAEESAEAPITL